jgi:predicted nuclease of predicted toxin-antitoxin system
VTPPRGKRARAKRIVWVDAQLSPALAPWIQQEFGIEAFSVRYLNLVQAKDLEIFRAARDADVFMLTKDADFVVLLDRFGPPPHVLWLRCGNTSNAHLRRLLRKTFRPALAMLQSGEELVEIVDLP